MNVIEFLPRYAIGIGEDSEGIRDVHPRGNEPRPLNKRTHIQCYFLNKFYGPNTWVFCNTNRQ